MKKIENQFLNSTVGSRNPFGINSALISNSNASKAIKVYTKQQETSWVEEQHITKNHDWIDKFKLIIGKAYGDVGNLGPYKVINNPIIAEPGSVCSESKLVIGVFDTKEEAVFMAEYLCTKFARFMLLTLKVSQNITKSTFSHVPNQTYGNKLLKDEILYKKYNLSKEEVEYIESNILDLDYIL